MEKNPQSKVKISDKYRISDNKADAYILAAVLAASILGILGILLMEILK